MNFDDVAKKWIMKQDYIGYGDHRESCNIIEETITNIEFVAESGGGCQTCFYYFPAVLFTANCSCKNAHISYEINIGDITFAKLIKQIIRIADELQAD